MLHALDTAGVRYALVGGHALAARGYPRFTVDVDLLTTDGRALDASTWTALEAAGASVERRRGDTGDPLAGVVHILLADETDVDVVVAREAWQAEVIGRAEAVTIAPNLVVPVPQAADLILLKLAAGGVLDVRDAAALLATDRAHLAQVVESRLGGVTPNLRSVWHDVLAMAL